MKMDGSDIQKLKRTVGLQPYNSRLALKKAGREYKAICPFHPDRNPSLSVYEKDTCFNFKCWGCDASGDVIEFVSKRDKVSFNDAVCALAAEAGMTMEKTTMVQKSELSYDKAKGTKELSANEEALAYLDSRGISPEAAVKHDLGIFDYPGVGRCIAIPYATGEIKFRAISPKDKPHKFRSSGTPNSKLYGIETLADALLRGAAKVLVVESELDCITSAEHLDGSDFAVVSVPSATGSLSSGELRIEKDHIEKLAAFDGQILLATDQDNAGEQWATAALKVLPAYKTSRVTWTGAKDIGELYTKFKESFAKEISRLCEESTIPLLWRKAVPFSMLPEKKLSWIVPDLIPADGVTLLTGDFGSFKSYISLFLADTISRGGTFVDRKCEQHPVLILDRENSHSTIYVRRNRIGELAKRENVRLLGLFTEPPAPDVTDPGLFAVCAKIKPVIIIDSLTDFHRGLKESDPDDMTECFAGIRALVTAGAAGVIVLHHVPKSGNDRGGKYRGSTSIAAAVTSALFVEKRGSAGVVLKGFKSRDGEEQTIEIKLCFGSCAESPVTYEVICSGRDPESEARDLVEHYVQANPGCSKTNVADELNIRRTNALRIIDDMLRDGQLCPGPGKGGRGQGLYSNNVTSVPAHASMFEERPVMVN